MKQQKDTIRALTDIQKRAACHILGAFCTTAVAALEAELHIPPIHLTLRRACKASMHRIASSPHYQTIQKIKGEAHPGAKPKTHYKHLSPLQKLEAAHKDRYPKAPKREAIRTELFPLWEEPPEVTIPKTILGQNTKQSGRNAHDRALLDAKEEPGHEVFYTDGSEIKGQVGAATYNQKEKTGDSRSLGDNQTANVYAGELVGITMALDKILKAHKHRSQDDQPRKATIFSDSRASLQAITRPGNKSGQ